jgi:hypothetical protein
MISMQQRLRFISVLTFVLFIFSCTQEQKEKLAERLSNSSDEKQKTVHSTDGCCAISIPESWSEEKELNAKANLQAANRVKELYCIVLSESKEDFENMTMEHHSEMTRTAFMKSLSGSAISGPVSLTVDQNPAIQYEISGASNNVKIMALHTTVESQKYYHQILAWTIKSRVEKNKPILQKVIQSFKEVK